MVWLLVGFLDGMFLKMVVVGGWWSLTKFHQVSQGHTGDTDLTRSCRVSQSLTRSHKFSHGAWLLVCFIDGMFLKRVVVGGW